MRFDHLPHNRLWAQWEKKREEIEFREEGGGGRGGYVEYINHSLMDPPKCVAH